MKHLMKSKKYISWCAIAASFGVWIAAMAAMAAIPNEHAGARPVEGPRVAAVTGVLVLHQDPRTLETVPVREIRPL